MMCYLVLMYAFYPVSWLVQRTYLPINMCVTHTSKEIKCIGNSKMFINHRDFAFVMFSRLSVGIFGIARVEY